MFAGGFEVVFGWFSIFLLVLKCFLVGFLVCFGGLVATSRLPLGWLTAWGVGCCFQITFQ